MGKLDTSNKYSQPNMPSTLPDINDASFKADSGRMPKNDAVKRIRNLSQSAHAKAKGKGNDINVKVDKKCLSCSGQSSTVLSAFKLACLNYTSSKVE